MQSVDAKLGQCSQVISLDTLKPDPADHTVAVAACSQAHHWTADDRAKITASAQSSNQYKGVFVVKDVTPPAIVRYQMTSATEDDASGAAMQKVFGIGDLLIHTTATLSAATQWRAG